MVIFFLFLLMTAQTPDFEESFSFGFSHDWQIYDPEGAQEGPSPWFVEDGVLHSCSRIHGIEQGENESYPESRFFLTEPAWEDGTFLARISMQEDGGLALLFRVQDATHYYRLLILHEECSGEAEVRIDRREGDEITTLSRQRTRLPYPCGPWWTLGITMNTDSFQAFLNNAPLLNAKDCAFSKGGIGLSCWKNSGLRVDSLFFSQHEVNRSQFEPRASLLKGPVIGCVNSTGFEVGWETSILSSSLVEIIDGSKTIPFATESDECLFHRVKIQGLQPGKSYQYKVISGPMVSPVYRVQLPPDSPSQCSFCVYSNSHTDMDAHRFVIRSIARKTPDLVFHVGDMVKNGAHYDEWFPQFFDPADWLIHTIPFYLCPGNHERKTSWFDAFGVLPGNGHFYSHTFGNAFFMVLDSNQALGSGTTQSTWLEETLGSEEARVAKWKFCFIHEIPDCGQNHVAKASERSSCAHDLLDLLDNAGFDILFTGRYARYERQKRSSMHLVNTGGGGAPLDFGASANQRIERTQIQQRSVWHACRIQLDDRTMTFAAFTPDGKPFDSFEKVKHD
ncbi:MAG: metallophosphoesterase [Planctomycetota bacterium]